MGKITNVLNKIQESRQDYQNQRIPDLYHIKDARQTRFKMIAMMIIIAAGIIAIVFISHEIYNLEKSKNVQEKRINDLFTFLNKNQNLSDSQIQNFNFRLNAEVEDRKNQINNLALIDNAYYIDFMKSIITETHQINYLKSEMEKNSQAKDLANAAKED